MAAICRALAVLVGFSLVPAVAFGQAGGPRALFPELPPAALPAEPAPLEPEPPVDETVETPTIDQAPLPPPGLGARGLPRAEEALGGPLWKGTADADLAARIGRLPARVDDPTLRRMQRDLLLAPGPLSGAGADVIRARVDRLLAMGEAPAAAELMAALPDTEAAENLDDLRIRVLLAADQTDTACAMVDQASGQGDVVPEAQLVCAAVRGDRARVELGLSVLGERGKPAGQLLTSLLLSLGGSQKVKLREPPPLDPLLLPLLRRAPLEPEPKALAAASPAVRQAIAQNPNVPAGLAPPAVSPPVPPSYPGLDGQPPADWQQALQAVPEPLRPRWLAALDGLGAGPPDPVLEGLPAAARTMSGGRIDLGPWRDLEQATAQDERGPTLLDLLLLLDGRPAEAAPLSLRAAIAALRGLRLDEDARAVAAAGLANRTG